jgi:hypothetical protein
LIPPVAAFFLGVASVNGQTSNEKRYTEKEIDEVLLWPMERQKNSYTGSVATIS